MTASSSTCGTSAVRFSICTLWFERLARFAARFHWNPACPTRRLLRVFDPCPCVLTERWLVSLLPCGARRFWARRVAGVLLDPAVRVRPAGQREIRPYWKNYFDGTDALVRTAGVYPLCVARYLRFFCRACCRST